MAAQPTLIIEDVAAQPRLVVERGSQRLVDRMRGDVAFRHRDVPLDRGSEKQVRHDGGWL